jgi:hypothetical protein
VDTTVTENLRETAEIMRHELAINRLRVVLQPALHGPGMVRIVDDYNPEWYREFCALYAPSVRSKPRQKNKPDTYIKRASTLRAQRELAKGKCVSLYAQRLLPVVADVDARCRAGTYHIGG